MATMTHSNLSGLLARKLWLLAAVLLGFCLFSSVAEAQTTTSDAIFNGPQNMDQGLQSGLSNITGYAFAILKFLSVIALGVGYYFVTHNGVGKAILATVAAVLLWFAPVVVNIAQSLGRGAAAQSQVTG
jgi:hypothetical protein